MKPVLLIFFCIFSISIKVLAQETSIAGIIFDTESKDRIARVNVLNLRTGQSVYDNLNGVFKIDVRPGDQLVFNQAEYFADTVKTQNYVPIAIFMKRQAIQLQEVTIRDSLRNPLNQLMANRRDYSKAYGSLAYKDLLSVGPSGAGLSIDAIWNSLSREGRNATYLRQTIQTDYRQDVIDYRFNRVFVGRVTGLKDKQLTDFMQRYRPGYFFVAYAGDYEFISSIKTNLRRYFRNPRAYTLAPLYPAIKPAMPANAETHTVKPE